MLDLLGNMQPVTRCRFIYRRTLAPLFFERLEPRYFFDATDQSMDTVEWTDLIKGQSEFHAIALPTRSVDLILMQFSGDLPDYEYQPHIDWGDGTVEPGTIESIGENQWAMRGTHEYADAGVYDVTFDVSTDAEGGDDAGNWTKLSVGRDGIVPIEQDAHAQGDDHAIENHLVDFLDTGMTDDAQYLATIDWGDGRTGAGDVVVDHGIGTITADIQYARSGEDVAVITVQRLNADGTIAASGALPVTIDYTQRPINMDFLDQQGEILYTADGHVDETLAVFSASQAIDQYSGEIDWGDGASSPAQIVDTGTLDSGGTPRFAVVGEHDYAPGDNQYHYHISLQSGDGNTGNYTSDIITGADRFVWVAVEESMVWIDGPQYSIGGFPLGLFTDSGAHDGEYSVTIDWGDGTSGAGEAVTHGHSPQFWIFGEHDYAAVGTYNVSGVLSRPAADGSGTTQAHFTTSLQLITPDQIDEFRHVHLPENLWQYSQVNQAPATPPPPIETDPSTPQQPDDSPAQSDDAVASAPRPATPLASLFSSRPAQSLLDEHDRDDLLLGDPN